MKVRALNWLKAGSPIINTLLRREFVCSPLNLPTKIQNFCVIWKNIRNKIIEIKNILVISPTKTV